MNEMPQDNTQVITPPDTLDRILKQICKDLGWEYKGRFDPPPPPKDKPLKG